MLNNQPFTPYNLDATFNSELGRLSWDGVGRLGSSVIEIESTFQMDSLRLYSKPQQMVRVQQENQPNLDVKNYITEKKVKKNNQANQ